MTAILNTKSNQQIAVARKSASNAVGGCHAKSVRMHSQDAATNNAEKSLDLRSLHQTPVRTKERVRLTRNIQRGLLPPSDSLCFSHLAPDMAHKE